MELVFVEVIEGKEWVAEFQATSDFNLHIERESGSYITLSQRGTERGKYDTAWAKGVYEGQRVIDYDFGALVYPKYIKVTSGSKVLKAVVTCPEGEVTPIAVPTYEFVDLGLPSGTKWATCNLGATKPEESGLYFAWGETDGYSAEDVAAGKKAFTDADYKFYVEPRVMSKYNQTDGLTTLENVDDAAYYISDGLCKTPSKENFEELIANTTATEETLNGVKVWKLTSKVNDAFIFVPIKGMYMEGTNPADGIMAGLWSDTLFVVTSYTDAIQLMLDKDAGIATNALPRKCGMTIRPIQN